jgi:26S proteasome regulatory subunit (ATPase 3-interacting protein)
VAQATLKRLKAELSSLSSELKVDQLRELVAQLESEKAQLTARLEPLRNGTVHAVSEEEREATQSFLAYWAKRANQRRKIVKEVWTIIAEGMGNAEGVDIGALKVRYS